MVPEPQVDRNSNKAGLKMKLNQSENTRCFTSMTPTVQLNSFAMAKKIKPVYEHGEPKKPVNNDTMFPVTLTFDDIVIRASGKTKQEGRHNAARIMISELKHRYASDPLLQPPRDTDCPEVALILSASDHGLVPVFEYVREEGPLDNRIFTVQCKLAGLTMTGQGQGRKKARHDVSRKVLEHLRKGLPVPPPEPAKAEPVKDVTKEVSPTPLLPKELQNCPFEDPISVLQEVLVQLSLNPPSYDVQRSGTDQNRTFIIICTSGDHSHTATAFSKKTAKRAAAAGVLSRMGIIEKPKKKPKQKPVRFPRYNKFRYPPMGTTTATVTRQYPSKYGDAMYRNKAYELSPRAQNFSRRHPEQRQWLPPAQSHPSQNQYPSYYETI